MQELGRNGMKKSPDQKSNDAVKKLRLWIAAAGMLAMTYAGSVQAATDHTALVTSYEGSKTCRTCHPGAVDEMLGSIHYKLMGQVQDVYNMFTNRPVEGIHGKGNRY
jgi:hypothetical protein